MVQSISEHLSMLKILIKNLTQTDDRIDRYNKMKMIYLGLHLETLVWRSYSQDQDRRLFNELEWLGVKRVETLPLSINYVWPNETLKSV